MDFAEGAMLVFIRKQAVLPKAKEIRRLHGGVDVYAAHANVLIDAEIGKNRSFPV